MGFKVQSKMCDSCIYRKDSPLDLKQLEAEIADKYGGFKNHRTCHHSENVCCRGFWNAHKDEFQAGQLAQRLDAVEFVQIDILTPSRKRKSSPDETLTPSHHEKH